MKTEILLLTLLALMGCAVEEGVHEDGVFPAECEPGDTDARRWGSDCLCCHEGEFGAAGSVGRQASVAEIRVSDGVNEAVVAPDDHGNFFRTIQLIPPLTASLRFTDGREVRMQAPVPYGGCNHCHNGKTQPRLGDAPPATP